MEASGASIRLAESVALIWNSTRISNSPSVLRPRKRPTLLYVSQPAITWMPRAGPSLIRLRNVAAGLASPPLLLEKLNSSSARSRLKFCKPWMNTKISGEPAWPSARCFKASASFAIKSSRLPSFSVTTGCGNAAPMLSKNSRCGKPGGVLSST